ncbi:MAG TPA: helix-turn-helix domain-containing protein [Minicystis sp.]|nr:helix-turn-helix domain-containing protein [Minicystis sp.]
MSLVELAAAAGVTPRAIRHYRECGALPAPEFRSSRTRYGRDHLARLFAIRAMLADGRDLESIRRRLSTLTPAEIEAYLPPAPAPPAAPQAPPPLSSDAPWHRRTLLPGVELHVRADVSLAVRTFVQQLADQFLGGAA